MGSPTRESIQDLLKKSPYSASNQATLEAYVDAQASGSAPYLMDANRVLLKLYQFYPQNANEVKVAEVMLLAMLEYPSTDLLALRYLVPDRIQSGALCAPILKCASLLEACKFTDFWTEFSSLDGSDSIKKIVSSSKGKMQGAILEVLALTKRSASVDSALKSLNMSSSSELTGLKHPSVESVEGGKISFVASADNTKRLRVFQEGVNYPSIASMMAKVSSE
mmetsp:Transcript_95600/g.276139  ORF Transcript_95600/g.276139 Transcript_95600/m.276139 type:complete len:222 (-) Transcript_95600:37-702(-)